MSVSARACVHARMHVPFFRSRVRVVRLSSHVCQRGVHPNVLVYSVDMCSVFVTVAHMYTNVHVCVCLPECMCTRVCDRWRVCFV